MMKMRKVIKSAFEHDFSDRLIGLDQELGSMVKSKSQKMLPPALPH